MALDRIAASIVGALLGSYSLNSQPTSVVCSNGAQGSNPAFGPTVQNENSAHFNGDSWQQFCISDFVSCFLNHGIFDLSVFLKEHAQPVISKDKKEAGHQEELAEISDPPQQLEIRIARFTVGTSRMRMPLPDIADMAHRGVTFEEFASMLQRWRFDIYGRLPRRSVQSPLRRSESPTESWKRLLTLAHVPEPLSRNELIQMFYCVREKRCLFHYGIEVGRVQYWSWDLAQIHRNNPNTVQLDVWTNPGDIRTVIVVHPDTGKAITVPCKDPEMPPLTSAERDRILAANRRKPEDYFSAHEALAALIEGMHHAPRKKKSKMAKAGEEARRVHRDKEIVRKSSTRMVQDSPIEPAVAMLPVQIPTKRNKITMRG